MLTQHIQRRWSAMPDVDYFLWARRTFAFLTVGTLVVGFWPQRSTLRLPAARPAAALDGPASRTLEDYLSATRSNLFGSGNDEPVMTTRAAAHRQAAPRPVAAAAPVKPTLAQLSADLQLVGILENGTQAVILNRKSQETIYVTPGQRIGDVVVSSVHANGVKLTYDGESIDLSL